LARLANVGAGVAERVAAGLGMSGKITPAPTLVEARDMEPSPALSVLAKARATLEGRKVGCLITDGADAKLVAALKAAAAKAGAKVQFVAPTIAGVTLSDGAALPADHKIDGGPSILFDAVVVLASADGAAQLAAEAVAVNWVRDAFAHLKVIGHTAEAGPLFAAAGVMLDDPPEGVIALTAAGSLAGFTSAASAGRVWAREPAVRKVF
jgi:catalase